MNNKSQKLFLAEFEELILLAILFLKDDAYGVTIRQTLEEVAERTTSIGAVYTTLDRLEKKGFISSRQGEATPERGGRAKRYFKVEGAGISALTKTHHSRDRLKSNIDSLDPIGGLA